jgi:hypothetical protein
MTVDTERASIGPCARVCALSISTGPYSMGFYKGVHSASIYGAYTVGVCFKGLDTEKYLDETTRCTVWYNTLPPHLLPSYWSPLQYIQCTHPEPHTLPHSLTHTYRSTYSPRCPTPTANSTYSPCCPTPAAPHLLQTQPIALAVPHPLLHSLTHTYSSTYCIYINTVCVQGHTKYRIWQSYMP